MQSKRHNDFSPFEIGLKIIVSAIYLIINGLVGVVQNLFDLHAALRPQPKDEKNVQD